MKSNTLASILGKPFALLYENPGEMSESTASGAPQNKERDTSGERGNSNVVMAPRLFDISLLPSLKQGMSAEEEAIKRRKTCRFIEESGRLLKLPRVAVATAMLFFHRFFSSHSFMGENSIPRAPCCMS